jgi:hypothetical protein
LTFIQAFPVGLGAALLLDLVAIHGLRRVPRTEWPDWVTSGAYWILSALGWLIGGIVAGEFASNTHITFLVAANVGAAWPAIISAIAEGAEVKPPRNQVN